MREIWRDIKGYEELYQISNTGKIKSLKRQYWHKRNKCFATWKEKKIKPILNNKYLSVTLCKNGKTKIYKIHRLVAQAFIPNFQNKLQINHMDGNKLNNYSNNLEWCTCKENIQHAYNMKLKEKAKGEINSYAKLKEIQVYQIKWIAKFINVKFGFWAKLAKNLNVSNETISAILHNKSWKHVKI